MTEAATDAESAADTSSAGVGQCGDGVRDPAELCYRAVASAATAGRFGDFDGDGITDALAEGGFGYPTQLSPGRADGTFAPGVEFFDSDPLLSIATADFDRDGIDDVAIGRMDDRQIDVYFGTPGGVPLQVATLSIEFQPTDLVALDVDGEAGPDVLVFEELDLDPPTPMLVLRNDGTGTLVAEETFEVDEYLDGLTVVESRSVADVDGDGALDVALYMGFHHVGLLFGDGAGGFTAVDPFTPDPFLEANTATLMDLTADGRADLVVPRGGALDFYASLGRSVAAAVHAQLADEEAQDSPVFTSADVDADGTNELVAVIDRAGTGGERELALMAFHPPVGDAFVDVMETTVERGCIGDLSFFLLAPAHFAGTDLPELVVSAWCEDDASPFVIALLPDP